MAVFDSNDPAMNDKMREMMGPQAVEQQIGQAISFCWMILPADKKNVAAVEVEIRRIVERALKNLREDATSFGIPTGDSPPV